MTETVSAPEEKVRASEAPDEDVVDVSRASAEAIRNAVATAEAAGIDVGELKFEQLIQLIRTIREFEIRVRREAEQAGRQNREDLSERRQDIARFVIGFVLVLGVVAGILYGILIRTVEPNELLQYLAPITGFAGLAIGYFFSRSSSE